MQGGGDQELNLPAGDEDIISAAAAIDAPIIAEIDLYKLDPWQLPAKRKRMVFLYSERSEVPQRHGRRQGQDSRNQESTGVLRGKSPKRNQNQLDNARIPFG